MKKNILFILVTILFLSSCAVNQFDKEENKTSQKLIVTEKNKDDATEDVSTIVERIYGSFSFYFGKFDFDDLPPLTFNASSGG